MKDKVICTSRRELYEKVWKEPVKKVSESYGLSDNGLRKICKKHNIPLPPVGYWQKLEFGKLVDKTPLPHQKDNSEIMIEFNEKKKLITDEKHYAKAQKLIAFEKLDENIIKVPGKLNSAHPFIVQTRDSYETTNINNNDVKSANTKGVLNIHVSEKHFDRALRIMDTLIKALEERGFKVSITAKERHSYYTSYLTSVSVLGQSIEFRLNVKGGVKMYRRGGVKVYQPG